MREYKYMPLRDVERYVSEARRLGVSKVARGPGGFLSAYRRAGGAAALSDSWRHHRHSFIARTLAAYKAGPTYRRWLALVMWAYKPGPPPRH